jgi:nucleoid DNA-binding protein
MVQKAKTGTKKAAKVAKPKLKTVSQAYTKSELLSALIEGTEISKKDVRAVLDNLNMIITAHLKKGGPEQFKMPGLFKMSVKHKPATKARKGVNPFTGADTMFKAKPAQRAVKIKALKSLKEAIA